MTSLSDLIQQGAGNVWLFMGSAILLGALHGLEPGHSKTMMAAFIVAIRGTVGQAALLGVSAAASHTAVVWIVALTGLYFGAQLDNERTEAWFQLGSAVLIIAIAMWMFERAWRDLQASKAHGALAHHGHDHGHDHGDGHSQGHSHDHSAGHDHAAEVHSAQYQDAHEREHAADIARRFGNRAPTTAQIVGFGLTGGLIPCPAAITVLLLCLQLKKVSLGVSLVLGFSIGLALTMVLSGALAALSVRAVSKRFSGFGRLARIAPLLSCALIMTIGCWSAWVGWQALGFAA